MDLNKLSEKINSLQNTLTNDNSLFKICQNIKENNYVDQTTKLEAENDYYSFLPVHEKIYQKKNAEYTELISKYSQAYLDICDFYVGPEIPRETYLYSPEDVTELFTLFILGATFEPYINAYHDKYILK